jgi:hypothetical protein
MPKRKCIFRQEFEKIDGIKRSRINKNSEKWPSFKEKLRKFGAFGDNLPILSLNYPKKVKIFKEKRA